MNAAEFAVYSRREWRAPVFRFPAAHYDTRPEDLSYDGSNRVILGSDKSGNSAVNVLCLNGVAGNYASALDSNPLDITGDSEYFFRATVTALSGTQVLIDKGTNAYAIYFIGAGSTFTFEPRAGGTPISASVTLASLGLSALTQYWFRVEYDLDSGAGNYACRFFYAADQNSVPSSWTQIGATQTGVSSAPVSGTTQLSIGQSRTATSPWNGNILWVRILNGLAGTVVFDANFSLPAKLATSFTESSSNAATVTINSTGATGARISGARDAYQGIVANQPVLTLGADGRYYLLLDGSNDYLKSPAFALAQPETVYFVGSQVTWTSGRDLFDGGGANTMVVQQTAGGASPVLFAYAGNNGPSTTSLPVATNGVLTSVFNGASSFLRVNRLVASTGNSGTASANGITIGAGGAGTIWSNITVSEVLIYGQNHDEIAQQRMVRDEMRKRRIPMAA